MNKKNLKVCAKIDKRCVYSALKANKTRSCLLGLFCDKTTNARLQAWHLYCLFIQNHYVNVMLLNILCIRAGEVLLPYINFVIASWYLRDIGIVSQLGWFSSATIIPALFLCTIFIYAGLMK